MKKETQHFQESVLSWYDKNKRDLPWRKNKNPYSILLSEVILQQTRVAQGLAYYEKFMQTFPTVETLANADEQQVLKLWQGLGYYSRARNLHTAAKQIVNDYDGILPSESSELKKLKGVGKYTAAAIASIAFNEPVAVVDGNVYRVIARYLGIGDAIDSSAGQKIFEQAATDLLWKKNPGKYNQAIMEFGAQQCVPVNPNCEICPINNSCSALRDGLVKTLPRKEKSIKIKKRFFNYWVIHFKGEIVVQKRNGKDIWEGLYQFPLFETEKEISTFSELLSEINHGNTSKSILYKKNSRQKKHLLTHQELHPVFWEIEWLGTKKALLLTFPDSLVLTPSLAEEFPYPKIIENFWKKSNS
jgi:A/G-specific adenine glycosylase